MRLQVRDLRRWFGPLRAVDGVSFNVPPGEIWGFVGPNGDGKTTTMRILATLDEPTAGDALLDGVSIVEEPEAARRAVGYMPDALPVHRDITVHDYLDFFARAYGLKAAARRRVVEGVEEFTQLGGLRERTIDALSKGMKQRVSLARALVLSLVQRDDACLDAHELRVGAIHRRRRLHAQRVQHRSCASVQIAHRTTSPSERAASRRANAARARRSRE